MGRYGNYFVAVIFLVVGLHLLGVIPLPFSGLGQVGLKRKGLLAALMLWISSITRRTTSHPGASKPKRPLIPANLTPHEHP